MASKVKFVTPFGVAQYPHLNKPDTKGRYADNKYKTKLVLRGDDPDTQAFVKKIDAAVKELHGSDKASIYRPYEVDDESGDVIFISKSKYAPAIFDAKNRSARKAKIGRGSTLRLMGEFIGYGEGKKAGVSAQLHQVQIKELNGWGSSGFDEVEDGYEYDPEEFAEDEAANSNSSDSDDSDASEAEDNAALDI
jgi:hypothetical protein